MMSRCPFRSGYPQSEADVKRIVAGGVIMAVCATFSTGCAQIENLVGKAGSKAEPATKPPAPSPAPALTPAQAKRTVVSWSKAFNRAAKKYDIKAAEKIETGALLEGHRAEFKILKFNDLKVPPMSATRDLTIPKFTGWPKWFTVTMTSAAETPVVDQVIFVQQKKDGPWQAASDTVVDKKVLKKLGSAVAAPADAEVVPAGDASLAIAPSRLPMAHAHAIRYGPRSPYAKLFGRTVDVPGEFKELVDAHKLFTKHRWTGRMTVYGSPHPVYVLRTPSGGAVAFYSVDTRAAYKRSKGDISFSWNGGIGKLYPALIGREYAEDEITRVERSEYAAYIPPKGEGRIQIVATRWTPVSAEGS